MDRTASKSSDSAAVISTAAKQYPKLGKAQSGYLEIGFFKNADLHTGYFCYDCIYYVKDNQCAIVKSTGPDIRGEESDIIAPHGVCSLWEPNEEETR